MLKDIMGYNWLIILDPKLVSDLTQWFDVDVEQEERKCGALLHLAKGGGLGTTFPCQHQLELVLKERSP